MILFIKSLLLIICFSICCYGQTTSTANDKVPAYAGGFRFGTNLGGPKGEWNDEKLATLAAGSVQSNVPGAGCNSLRLSLPNSFLDKWGYDIRVNTFKFYKDNLGMNSHTVFLGGPADANKETKTFCASKGASKMFAKMYEPIWDKGENGTPVNDNNPMAVYFYNTALKYKETVAFWEIWNEPDYTTSDMGWQSADATDSWWKRDPDPCELNNLLAPVQQYVRALRIAYEVIKSVDPDAFICVGGIGYESFLDAVLRNTDNPDNGKVTTEYPKKGGAWFDCLSYHSYPMYGVREYKNGAWVNLRHSDKAVEVFLQSKTVMERVLADYGYNGATYPKKRVIVTETNIPKKSIDSYIGSETAQNNYLAKIIVKGQASGIDQIHTYNLYQSSTVSKPHDAMGFYPYLEAVKPFQQTEFTSAVTTRNAMTLLKDFKFSKEKTTNLALPASVDGAAFVNKNGKYIYVLWAKTKTDNSETTSANYTFPSTFGVTSFARYEWNYTKTGMVKTGQGATVQLNGSPAFFILNNDIIMGLEDEMNKSLKIHPNPSTGIVTLTFGSEVSDWQVLQIYDTQGREILRRNKSTEQTEKLLHVDLPKGLFIVKIYEGSRIVTDKILIE